MSIETSVCRGIWREWKERRGEKLSDTTYYGLEVGFKGRRLLITDLSHGLRVLCVTDNNDQTNNRDKYEFMNSGLGGDTKEGQRPLMQDSEPVIVPPSFLEAVEEFFLVDKKFQKEQDKQFAQLRFASIHGKDDD